ncbi:hypothetical protein SprV_0301293000 [Sparganum proliferum]
MRNSLENTRILHKLNLKLDALLKRRACCPTSAPTPAPAGPLFKRISTLQELDVFNSSLSDAAFRQQVRSHLLSFGGETISAFVDRIFSVLFADEITHHLTFYGRQQGKRAFYGSSAHALVVDVFTEWNVDQRSDHHQLEKTFRTAFQRAYNRLLKRGYKVSTSHLVDDCPRIN